MKPRALHAATRSSVIIFLSAALVAACGSSTDSSSDSSQAQATQSDSRQTVATASKSATATVTRRDIVDTKTFDGTFGYGDPQSLPTNTTGIVTALPEDGTIIEFGQTLFEVDGYPVILLPGDVPQYRPYNQSTPDGADIEQFELALLSLDLDTNLNLTADDQFTATTKNFIKEWQEHLGVSETGKVELGRIVFSPNPIRISANNAVAGQNVNPALALFSTTGTEHQITIALNPEDRDHVSVGESVEVEFPDGDRYPAQITSVAEVATRVGGQGTGVDRSSAIEVVVVLDEEADGVGFDAAPVKVTVVEIIAQDVLSVPVTALLALSDSGFALEVVGESSNTYVAVEVGEFEDSIVEVVGNINEGDIVIIPS